MTLRSFSTPGLPMSRRASMGQQRVTAVLVSLALTAGASSAQGVKADIVATGLQHPWAVAFLPEGRFLVTERPGRLRVVEPDGKLGPPVTGVPEVAAGGQGGLLDLVLDADFERNRTLYFCFSEPAPAAAGAAGTGANSTALARATLSRDRMRLEDVKIVFRQKPKIVSSLHFGCRIVEARKKGQPDGTLFLTLGERYQRAPDAQTLDNHHGKVVRVHKDGRVPQDNPFVARPGTHAEAHVAGALPEIWSYGHRNPQGATLAPDGTLWLHEHGPQGGDEINLPQPGRNYGWPVITYGEQYGGGPIGEGLKARAGMEQPLHYWVPSIAPSGMVFLTSERYGAAWRGNLFVGSLKFQYLNRIELLGGRVVREHKLLTELGQRIRDVRQGPDGLLYVLTDSPQGRLVRVAPP